MLKDFINLIFPNLCLGCHEGLAKGEVYLCTPCIYKLPRTNYHLLDENPLEQRFYGLNKMKHVLSYLKFVKDGSVSNLLYKLKYENCPDLGKILGRWYGFDLLRKGINNEYDLIIPVPIHKSKIRKRGYNQSDEIAKGLSEALELPWNGTAIVRAVKNESQTRKGRIDRWKNVENVFKVLYPELIAGKRVLLVDDVLTTGATLDACASSLYEAGCTEIGIVTLASA